MKGDPEKGGKIENRDRLYFHARFGLSILRKSEKRREEETEEKSEISFRCTTGCVREKWDRREENRQSLFSPNGMTLNRNISGQYTLPSGFESKGSSPEFSICFR